MRLTHWLTLPAALVIAFLPALGGFISRPDAWYQSLSKPAWNPPSWVFGPVWTALYATMGVASWLVWRERARRPRHVRAALAAYAVQLALNAAWSPLFFGLRRPDLALIDIVLLWAAIVATVVLFWRVHKAAGAILLPYLAWVTFATALNLTIWRLNP
ncbi:MAG TPA: TspO/MBR family protein [Phycisphaerales bacterium]|nr:TspO/MBR family protein [Phycisphaerales bacterium]